jgi:hypothetical protein
MKKFTFLVIAMMLSLGALMAQNFTVASIGYNYVTDATGTDVIAWGAPGFTGALVIPATVTNGGTTYNVTGVRNYFISKFGGPGCTSITVSEGIQTIGVGSGGSFDDSGNSDATNITSISLPSTLTTSSFTNFSFNSLPALTDFTIKCTTPPTIESENTFYAVPGPLTIHIPAGTLSAYQNAGWSNVLHATLVEDPAPPVVQTTVPTVDFETVGNTWSWGVFGNGINATDDPANMVVPFANPSATGINSSANCAKFINDATATVWGGCQSEGIGTFILNDQNCIVKMMVYKDVISDCMLKFAGDEGDVAIMVPNTKINEWEELTFDFSAKIGTTYKNIQLVPDHPAIRTVGSTSYFDNISFNPAPPVVQTTVPTVDFETVGNTWSWGVFGNGINGADTPDNMVVPFANPSATGINSSANCAKFINDATATVWGGCQSEGIGTFILNDQNCIVKMMVYKDVISDCMLKFAGDEGDVAIMVPNTKINEWEELTFDFSATIGITYKNIQLVPDHPATRTAGSTSYFDNISFNPVVLPVGTNIAKGLIATTNCTNVLQGTGDLVTDEGTWTSDSRWRLELASALPDPAHAYVALDFGSDQVIDSVVINAGYSGDNGLTGDSQITDFILQSFDGTTWNDIPGASVAGNSLLIIPFHFTPALTTSQIRMDITAVSPLSEGQIKLYEFKVYGTPAIPTKISSVKAAKGLNTYPNPVKDQMQVNLSGSAHQGGIIEIINLTGKVLKTQQVDGAGTVSVNMSQLSKGLYFCRYTNGAEIKVAKIIKQ